MNIQIDEAAGHVSALGHRVPLEQGGVSELKRRCLETLAHYDAPPDEVRFLRPGQLLAEERAAIAGAQGAAPTLATLAPANEGGRAEVRATEPLGMPGPPGIASIRHSAVAKTKDRRGR